MTVPIDFISTAVMSLKDVFKASKDRSPVSAMQRSISQKHASHKSNRSMKRHTSKESVDFINLALEMNGQRASSISPVRKKSDSKSSLKQDSIDSIVPLYMTATKKPRLPSSRHQLSLFVNNLSQNLKLSQKILT